MFGPTEYIWVQNRRSHNALQEQQQGKHWPEKFPWPLTVREVFWGWVTGLNATAIENEMLKKGEWLSDNQVLFLVPQSHECRFFLTPSSSVLSRARCRFDRVKTHADTHWCVRSSWSFLQTPDKYPSWRIRRITLKPKPLQVTTSSPVLPKCVTGLLFSASLLPCSASRSDSSWLTQAAYHCDPLADLRHNISVLVWREDPVDTELMDL